MLTVVFQNSSGFVTDFGEELRAEGGCRNPQHALTDGNPSPHETGPSCMAESFSIPRYGVWKFDPYKNRHQVTFASNDLDECKSALAPIAPQDRCSECHSATAVNSICTRCRKPVCDGCIRNGAHSKRHRR